MAQKCNCGCLAHYHKAYTDFLTMPRWVSMGAKVSGDCPGCSDYRAWGIMQRSNVWDSLCRAVQTVEKVRGCSLCPKEKMMIVDEPDCCPIVLERPIWYLGRRKLVHETEVDICYTYKDAVPGYGTHVGCEDLNLIGQAIVTDIPETWWGDYDHVEYDFPLNCRTDHQCLMPPCYDFECASIITGTHDCQKECDCVERCAGPCEDVTTEAGWCGTISITLSESCETVFTLGQRVFIWTSSTEYKIGTVTTIDEAGTLLKVSFIKDHVVACADFLYISIPFFVATWEQYELVDPRIESTELGYSNCVQRREVVKENFLDKVLIQFYVVDETEAVIPIAKCSCSSCKICNCHDCGEEVDPCTDTSLTLPYEYEVDTVTGEVCITLGKTCSCPQPHRLMINYGVKPEPDRDVTLAVVLRALLWSHTHIKCKCEDSDKIVEHWLALEGGVGAEAFASRREYPYGKSKAGVELVRLLEGDDEQKVRDGKILSKKGGFYSARKLRGGIRGGGNRRTHINPREDKWG